MSVKFRERSPAPFQSQGTVFRTIHFHVHHRHVLLLDFPNLTEFDVVRETGQVIAMRHQVLESGASGTRKEEEQTRGDDENRQRHR
jgi:hypothetical protein